MAIDAEITRIMTNWARWKSGVSLRAGVSAAYDMESHGRREEAPVPLANGEAMDVDAVVVMLPEELCTPVREWWLRGGTVEAKAKRCRCAVATLYRRLEHAHERVRDGLQARRDRGLQLRGQRAAVMEAARPAAREFPDIPLAWRKETLTK